MLLDTMLVHSHAVIAWGIVIIITISAKNREFLSSPFIHNSKQLKKKISEHLVSCWEAHEVFSLLFGTVTGQVVAYTVTTASCLFLLVYFIYPQQTGYNQRLHTDQMQCKIKPEISIYFDTNIQSLVFWPLHFLSEQNKPVGWTQYQYFSVAKTHLTSFTLLWTL